MRRSPLLLTALVAALSLLLPLGATADPATTETVEQMFTHNPNTACAEKGGVLTYTATAGSNCGYIYGAPIGEVDGLLDESGQGRVFDNVRTYTTDGDFGAVVLDADRDVSGVVQVASRESACVSPWLVPVPAPDCVSHAGTGAGAGQIVVDLALSGTRADADEFAGAESLGTVRVEGVIAPGETEIQIPYAIDLPDTAGGVAYRQLSFSVDVRGVHWGTGYADASGATTVDIPSLTPVQP